MERLEERPFSVPAPRVLGHQAIFIDQADFFHGGHYEQLAVDILDRQRVIVVVESHQRLESTVRSVTRRASNVCLGIRH
jgi:hypothetical protein